MRNKYATRAATLFHQASKLRQMAGEIEREASRLMEAETSIEYDMEADLRKGQYGLLDSAIDEKEPDQLEKMVKDDASAISEDPDMDFSGLIVGNDFRPRTPAKHKVSAQETNTRSARRRVHR